MSSTLESAERPMVPVTRSRNDRRMDEDTLDCTYCTTAATLEVRVQYLADNAEWRTKTKIQCCDDHAGRLEIAAWRLMANERLLAQRLS
ncbi:MAG: hypothetical protein [Circular genetic element sp.]|nr:MAG: hypothetical protein [Circular genetic element sp.]